MTTDQIFLGIDSGTQGTKVAALNRARKAIVADAYAPHALIEGEKDGGSRSPSGGRPPVKRL